MPKSPWRLAEEAQGRLATACLALAVCVAACSDDAAHLDGDAAMPPAPDAGDASCAIVAETSLDCAPRFYPPEFSEIHGTILFVYCGAGSCHGAPAESSVTDQRRQSSRLRLADIGRTIDADQARENLIEPSNSSPSVIVGHPECSELMRRLESDDPHVRMPPPRPLADDDICAIRLWIASGANAP